MTFKILISGVLTGVFVFSLSLAQVLGQTILENAELPDSEFEDEITFDTSSLCDISATGYNYPPKFKKRTDGSNVSERLNKIEEYHTFNLQKSEREGEWCEDDSSPHCWSGLCIYLKLSDDKQYPDFKYDPPLAVRIAQRWKFRCIGNKLEYMAIQFFTDGSYCGEFYKPRKDDSGKGCLDSMGEAAPPEWVDYYDNWDGFLLADILNLERFKRPQICEE